MTAKKWLTAGLIAILVLLGGGAAYLQTLDWNRYKAVLTDAVADQTGLNLTIGGSVALTLFPRPALTASQLVLSNPALDGSLPLATLDELSVDVAFAPLFQGRVAPQQVTLVGLDLTLKQNAEGQWWRDNGTSAGQSQSGLPLLFSDLAQLTMINSRLSVTPFQADTRVVAIADLALTGRLGAETTDIAAALAIDGVALDVEGRLQPTLNRDFQSIRAAVALAGGSLEVTGRLGAAGGSARFSGEGADAGRYVKGLAALIGSPVESNANLPFSYDVSLTYDRPETAAFLGGGYEVVARQFAVGETRGRADLKLDYKPSAYTLQVNGAIETAVLNPVELLALVVTDEENENLPGSNEAGVSINGAVDVDIAALKVGDGIAQQIATKLEFRDQEIDFTGVAILPGATDVTVAGRYSRVLASETTNDIGGVIDIKSAQLRDLMAWVGADVAGLGPADRLATGTLKADFSLREADWKITNIRSTIDTSSITGDIEGTLTSVWPTTVILAVDKLPLAAWLDDDGADDNSQTFCLHPQCLLPDGLTDSQIQLDVGRLYLGKTDVSDAKLVIRATADRIEISEGGASFFAYNEPLLRLDMTGTLSRSARGAWSSDVGLSLTDLSFEPLSLVSDTGTASTGLAKSEVPLSGRVTFGGLLDDMTVSADLSGGDYRYNGSGTVNWLPQRLTLVSFQGGFDHPDVAPLIAELSGQPMDASSPLTSTVSLSREDQRTEIRIGGRLNGVTGPLQLSLDISLPTVLSLDTRTLEGPTIGNQMSSVSFSLSGDRAASLEAYLPIPDGLLDSNESVAASGVSEVGNGRFVVRDLSVIQSARRLSGGITYTRETNTLAGRLSLEGLRIDLPPNPVFSPPAATEAQSTAVPDFNLQLAVLNSQILGQDISFSDVSLTSDDRGLSITANAGQINGKPAQLSLQPMGAGGLEAAVFKAEALKLGELLKGLGYPAVLSGTANADVSLNGVGTSITDWFNSISGEGSLTIDGATLLGVDALGLIGSVERSGAISQLLKGLPTFLTGGRSVGQSQLAFRATEGVVLLDEFSLIGPWGALALDGQLNVPADLMRVQGALTLSQPQVMPAIPILYAGSLRQPTPQFETQQFLSVAQILMQGRLRDSLAQIIPRSSNQGPIGLVLGSALKILEKAKRAEADKTAQQTASQPDDGR